MSRSWWWRFVFCCLMVLSALIYLYPTFRNLDPLTSTFPVKKKMNLGLDLQGGVYLVLGVDFEKFFKEILEKQVAAIKEGSERHGVAIEEVFLTWKNDEKAIDPSNELSIQDEPVGPSTMDPRIEVVLKEEQKVKFLAWVKKEFTLLRLTASTEKNLEFGLASEYKRGTRDRTVSQSIDIIRNRIDGFGVTEPVISSQGFDRVVVELPGVKDVDRAKQLIGRTAQLDFRVVIDSMPEAVLLKHILEAEKEHANLLALKKESFSHYVQKLNEILKGKLPPNAELLFGKARLNVISGDADTAADTRHPCLLSTVQRMSGSDLQDVAVHYSEMDRRPIVEFKLNPRGALAFEKLTRDNVGSQLGVVLDNVIHSTPTVNQAIAGGKVQITLGHAAMDDAMKEAKDLATVLRAGSLPAQLNFLEERIIGPSLGVDSIYKGAMASLIGSLLVCLFVAFYYRISGLIAVLSLFLNVLFVLALLVSIEATLTLPGIAGIALTVGIAVDSNVVIYERIREELRLGKKVYTAVMAGFNKAFRTILDANVTNALASLVLLAYGTGPIKGFAVTLLIGIVTTLFTAVFICKLMFELYLYYLSRSRSSHLSI